ncbi:FKBP12-interacting protein of 37 kDa [Capsicum baccatum]|uniref:FKBP12-interacting protein of 37 kDa n=1 Tax=Capsicum baccatum TaxID=33114 RepID=A0A2G2V0A3_CAPBA|nr:FKBP12-interacting protein of 37 kDa [Capsicum baccatum]
MPHAKSVICTTVYTGEGIGDANIQPCLTAVTSVSDGLKGLYNETLKPLEQTYHFNDFSSPTLNLVEEKDKKVKELQDKIVAVNFTPESKMGKMLMAKCRTLQEENEEIGN